MKEAKKYLKAYVLTMLFVGIMLGGICVLGTLALGIGAGPIGYFAGGFLTALTVCVLVVYGFEEYADLIKLLEEEKEEP